MASIIQIRRDTAANWTSANPVLSQGELGIETNTLKIKAGDGTTSWTSLGYLIDVGDYLTSSSTNTLTNKTITNLVFDGNYTEEVYTNSGTTLEPDNGTIQVATLSGNVTYTDGLSAGQSLVLMLNGGASYTVTWPTMTWVGSGGNVAPTLTANDVIVFWKVSTTLYGAWVGSAA